ncbi:hypothetical protein [Alkalihalobacillus sp. AL-G]|uniref:hypothetical protein n=1 Tax=Alkalihalobacillus sp. AL-G TaxID=2926399 RepID=UPI00272D5DF4|nr:hypothetical protein [Alkalihalobacillus sp. AL-G]WLD94351.1 hypothetical protein MOJ78_05535 [Alkalihalobacillus sp. AL-G]
MKYFITIVLFGAVLFSYFNSNITWYKHLFSGESEHWTATFSSVSHVLETDQEKPQNQHLVKYMTKNKLKLTFKGSLEQLGTHLRYSYEHHAIGGSASDRKSNKSTFHYKVFTSSGGSGGEMYYPKDMEFIPVHIEEGETIPVKIEWDGKTETLTLKKQ